MQPGSFDLQKYVRAGNPKTPMEELINLASNACNKVRRRVAENSNLSLDTLLRLAQDHDPEVRIAVGENKAASEAIVEKIASDEHIDVRLALAENSNLSKRVLHLLAKDENPYVSNRALNTLEKLEQLASNKGAVVVFSITHRQGDSELRLRALS
jgi:hypothetical protein